MAGFLSSLRYLLADFIGEHDGAPPPLPDGLPDGLAAIVSEGIGQLTHYQGASYAKLYVERLQRYLGRRDIDEAMVSEIAQLMAMRMSYEDPIRIAQLTLAGMGAAPARPADDVRWFRLDELIGALPAVVARPVLDIFDRLGWGRRPVSVRFSTASWWGIRRLKIEASLRRWRRFSVRYAEERVWVERWLHMIGRCLTKQPGSVAEIIRTATMVQGYGDAYRQGLADWHAIIDGLAKATFDGALPLADLAGAVRQARAAAMPDPRQVALKRAIAQIRARALDDAAPSIPVDGGKP